MIVAFIFTSTVLAFLAGSAALLLGHPWWTALAIYMTTGVLTVLVLAFATCFTAFLHHKLTLDRQVRRS